MKHLLLTLFLSVSCFGITVSNITVSDVSHGSFFLSFTTDTSINAARVRYTASPATCTGGTGGIVAVPSINFSQPNPYEGALSGFAAGTTY